MISFLLFPRFFHTFPSILFNILNISRHKNNTFRVINIKNQTIPRIIPRIILKNLPYNTNLPILNIIIIIALRCKL